MYYVYLLRSKKTDKYYVGYCKDLRQRFYSHNKGENKATKPYTPWELVYYEAYPAKEPALERERVLKNHGRTLSDLKRRILLGRST